MVIGSIAIIAHGVRRFTTDIDAAVRGDAIRPEELLGIFESHGIEPRIRNAASFARENLVLLLRHGTTGVDLDVSFAWSAFEHDALAAAFAKAGLGWLGRWSWGIYLAHLLVHEVARIGGFDPTRHAYAMRAAYALGLLASRHHRGRGTAHRNSLHQTLRIDANARRECRAARSSASDLEPVTTVRTRASKHANVRTLLTWPVAGRPASFAAIQSARASLNGRAGRRRLGRPAREPACRPLTRMRVRSNTSKRGG